MLETVHFLTNLFYSFVLSVHSCLFLLPSYALSFLHLYMYFMIKRCNFSLPQNNQFFLFIRRVHK